MPSGSRAEGHLLRDRKGHIRESVASNRKYRQRVCWFRWRRSRIPHSARSSRLHAGFVRTASQRDFLLPRLFRQFRFWRTCCDAAEKKPFNSGAVGRAEKCANVIHAADIVQQDRYRQPQIGIRSGRNCCPVRNAVHFYLRLKPARFHSSSTRATISGDI